MAVQRIESPDPQMTPEAWAARQALTHQRSHERTAEAWGSVTWAGLIAVAALGGYLLLRPGQQQASFEVNAVPNQQPGVTQPVPAEVVEAYTATPTQILPTETPLPPSATFVLTGTATEAATETPEPTAGPTATERVKPTERPLPLAWSPELSQKDQLRYLNHLYSEAKKLEGIPFGIFKLTDPEVAETPKLKWIEQNGFDPGDTYYFGDKRIVSGIFLSSSDGSVVWPLTEEEAKINIGTESSYRLAVPYFKDRMSEPSGWVILWVHNIDNQCDSAFALTNDGKTLDGHVNSGGRHLAYFSEELVEPGQQMYVEVTLESPGGFWTEMRYPDGCKGLTLASSFLASPPLEERFDQLKRSGGQVTYLGQEYTVGLKEALVSESPQAR